MRILSLTILFILSSHFGKAQLDFLNGLYQKLNNSKEDTSKVLVMSDLADYYGFNQFDSCIAYSNKVVELSKKLDYPYSIIACTIYIICPAGSKRVLIVFVI